MYIKAINFESVITSERQYLKTIITSKSNTIRTFPLEEQFMNKSITYSYS